MVPNLEHETSNVKQSTFEPYSGEVIRNLPAAEPISAAAVGQIAAVCELAPGQVEGPHRRHDKCIGPSSRSPRKRGSRSLRMTEVGDSGAGAHPACSGSNRCFSYHSALRSFHVGFCDTINAIFFSRVYPLICFSRAIAL
jgi:hypothetical protein